ncbi:unnamed protein product [Gemmataceae bacterium]|nr:unnamed protein product [Gemmataceae bacterium]VTT98864.1 unnamed protein product [Gemmataceae bacterium]
MPPDTPRLAFRDAAPLLAAANGGVPPCRVTFSRMIRIGKPVPGGYAKLRAVRYGARKWVTCPQWINEFTETVAGRAPAADRSMHA